MKISVVVATHRRPQALQRCLAALATQDLPTADFEVIAVADGPEIAPTLELPFEFRWLELDRNQGQSAARNAGARAASAEYLLFLDDDMLAESGLVRFHLERQAPGRVVFGRSLDSAQTSYYGRLDQDATPRWPDDAWFGPNCSIARSLFEAAGGFDETAFPRCGEDIDLGFRLWARGAEFVYSREATAVHDDRKGWLARLRAEAAHGAAAIALCRRYPKYRRHVPLRAQRRAWWKRLAAELPFWGGSSRAAWFDGCKNEAGGWQNLQRMMGAEVAVLLYHHIGEPAEDPALRSLSVPREQFRRHLAWLARHRYTPITPSDWLAWLDEGIPLPERPVMITFDDGLADLQWAFSEAGATGAVFAITDLVRTAGRWEGRKVADQTGLAAWSAKGIEIGGHTRTHPDLRGLRGAELEREVSGCRSDLLEFGMVPVAFAYPFGEFNDEVVDAVARVFPLAFTCEEGLNHLHTPPHLLRRTMILPGDSMVDFRFRVRLGRSPLNEFRSWLRLRSRFCGLLRRLGF